VNEKYPPRPIRYWLQNFDEERYPQGDRREWSPILYVCGYIFGLLRRLSVTEWIKRWGQEWHPNNRTPARVNDTIVVVKWVLVFVGGTMLARVTQERHWLKYVALAGIVQIVQTTLYHNIWRTLVLPDDHPMRHGYNPVRTLITIVGNGFAIAWLFGLAYWWQGKRDFGWQFDYVFDAIYFSCVTFATVGYGDIHPERGHLFAQSLVVFEIAVSMCMLSIVISQAIGAVGNVFKVQLNDPANPSLNHTPDGAPTESLSVTHAGDLQIEIKVKRCTGSSI
jgi:hypothetical protein